MNHLKIYPLPQQKFEKFGDVYRAVEDYIRNGKHTNQSSLMKLTSFSEVPELEMECYEVFNFGETVIYPQTQTIKGSKYAVIRMVWLGDRDWKHWDELGAEKYTPNIVIHALEISRKQFDEFFDLFRNARISIFPDPFAHQNNMGCDGVTYELSFGDDWLGVTYEWWHQTSGTWKQLSESAMQAKYLIDTWIAEHEKSQRKS